MSSTFDPAVLLRLCTVPKIGSQRIRKLVAHFKTPENVLSASLRQLVRVDGIDHTLAVNINKGGDADFAQIQIRLMQKAHTKLISYWDAEYPTLLKKIADPPILLFVMGNVAVLNSQGVAIVGTRNPSTYGKIMTERLARELVGYNLTVISGLARGIDTVAHKVVVQEGGATVAVLGSGVDQIYPEENRALAENILENGAVVSEFPMGAKPDAPHFPRRNRIIAGLSLGALVVEAGEKSGALITADFALDQNREVFALPGNINSPKSIGCNRLIQQGAKLVVTVKDIIDELEGQLNLFERSEKKRSVTLSGDEEKVYDVLSDEAKHIDRIAVECQMPTSQVLGLLLSLELKGVVQQLVGKNFVKS